MKRTMMWLGLALLALSALMMLRPAAAPAPRRPDPRPNTPERAAPAVLSAGQGFAPETPRPQTSARSYAIEFHNEFMPSESGAGDGEATLGLLLAFSGTLTVAPVDDGPETRWYRYRLSEISPLVDSEQRNWLTAQERAYLKSSLEQPFYVGVDARGRTTGLELTRPADAMIQGMLRAIAHAPQFVKEQVTGTAWRVAELDGVGEALVEYRAGEDGQYEKRKSKYLKLLTSTGLAAPVDAGLEVSVDGLVRGRRDGSELVELTLEETTSTLVGTAKLENHLELGLRFTRLEPAADARRQWAQGRRDRLAVDLTRLPELPPPDREQSLRALLGDETAESLLAAVRALDEEDGEERRERLAQLEALLALEPSSARALSAALARAGDAEASTLISALGNAGTPEAQHALRELAENDAVDVGRREIAIALLGLNEQPTAETLAMVEERSREHGHENRETALLALGNLAARVDDRSTGEAIVDDLVKQLEAADSESERLLHLGALGNTGDPRLPQVLAPWFSAPEGEVRGEALWALRLVEGEEATALLASFAGSDRDPRVRRKALMAVQYREEPQADQILAAAASSDPDAEVRLQALSVLATRRDPALRSVVQAVAQADADARVRAEAERILSQS